MELDPRFVDVITQRLDTRPISLDHVGGERIESRQIAFGCLGRIDVEPFDRHAGREERVFPQVTLDTRRRTFFTIRREHDDRFPITVPLADRLRHPVAFAFPMGRVQKHARAVQENRPRRPTAA